jgi:hypothetical protein
MFTEDFESSTDVTGSGNKGRFLGEGWTVNIEKSTITTNTTSITTTKK